MSLFGKNRITTDGIDGDEMLSDDVEMETDLTEDEIDPADDGGGCTPCAPGGAGSADRPQDGTRRRKKADLRKYWQ